MRLAVPILVGVISFGVIRAILRRRWELKRAIEIMDEQHRRQVAEIVAITGADPGPDRPPSWYLKHREWPAD